MARPKKTLNGRGNSEWMREQVLDAAEDLFARRGYHAAGLRDIGVRVGISNATLLHHFGSKLALYRAVLDRLALAIRALVESVAGDADDAPLESLLRFLRAFSAWTEKNPNYGLIAFREFMEKVVRESHLDYHLESEILARLGDIVRRGQRDGTFRTDVPVESFVVHLITTIWMGEISSETWSMLLGRETEPFRREFNEQGIANLLRALVADEERLAVESARFAAGEAMQS